MVDVSIGIARFSPRLLLIPLFVIKTIFFILLTSTAHAYQSQGGWVIDEIEGDVVVYNDATSDNSWFSPEEGEVLDQAITVKTGGDGKVVISRQGDVITVDPNTVLKLFDIRRENNGTLVNITPKSGRVSFRLKSDFARRIEVKTPRIVTIVTGTTFNVAVNGQADEVALDEGSVVVRSQDGSRQANLVPGQIATAGVTEALSVDGVTVEPMRSRHVGQGKL